MKLFIAPLVALCLTASTHAQTVKKTQCVIENGLLKNVTTDYDPATGNSYVVVNGTLTNFEQAHPATSTAYASNTTWFLADYGITVAGQPYIKYGLPRILEPAQLAKRSDYKTLNVYTEASNPSLDVIYIPTNRGCELQPYLRVDKNLPQKKIYYAEDWRVTTATDAAYYRLITLDETGKPAGLVQDFYATGEKQWEGYMSYLDAADNNKDITEGRNTWYHKNGKKASEVVKVGGREEGVYKSWTEEGKPETEMLYKNGELHGYYKAWAPNGQLVALEFYDHNRLHGNLEYHLSDGRLSYKVAYEKGKPVVPCYTRLNEDNHTYEVCTETFTPGKVAQAWQYSGGTRSRHEMDKYSGQQLQSTAGSKAVAYINPVSDAKALVNLSASFSVVAEEEDGEYGLVWNYTDTANFSYFLLSRDGWYSVGYFKNGERYGLEEKGTVKMSRGEYWLGNRVQTLSVTREANSMELWLNGNAIYNIELLLDFQQKGIGIITMGSAKVNFPQLATSYRKK